LLSFFVALSFSSVSLSSLLFATQELRRQQYRQQHVMEEWELEHREQERQRHPKISISPIKQQRRQKQHRQHSRQQQVSRHHNNISINDTNSSPPIDLVSSPPIAVVDPIKRKLQLAKQRERKRRAAQRLQKMAQPHPHKLEAAKEYKEKIKMKHLPPPINVIKKEPMSEKTLLWIEHASKSKDAKLQALEQFQHRLRESKMSPADRSRRRQRPQTTLSPVRAAWCRSASKPRRVATPYVSTTRGDGAFGCSGQRFPGASEFESDIGPGNYGIVDDPMTISNTGACKFNLSKTKDVIDLAVFAKKDNPGPGHYGVVDNPNTLSNTGACKFNLSMTMDTIDQAIFAKREIPGPGKCTYHVSSLFLKM
jgi:hypothetical protein